MCGKVGRCRLFFEDGDNAACDVFGAVEVAEGVVDAGLVLEHKELEGGGVVADGCVGAYAEVLGDFGVGGGADGQRGGESAATEAVIAIGASSRAIKADRSGGVGGADEVGLAVAKVFSVEGRAIHGKLNGVETARGSGGVGGASDEFGGVDVSARIAEAVGVAAACGFDGDGGHFAGGLDIEFGEVAVVGATTVAPTVAVSSGGVAVSVVVDDGEFDFLSEGILDDHDKAVGSGVVGVLVGLTKQGAVGCVICVECHTKDAEGSACVHERGQDASSVTCVESAAKGGFSAIDGGSGVGNAGGAAAGEVVGDAGDQFGVDAQRELGGIFAVSDRDFDGHGGGGGLGGDAFDFGFGLVEFVQEHPSRAVDDAPVGGRRERVGGEERELDGVVFTDIGFKSACGEELEGGASGAVEGDADIGARAIAVGAAVSGETESAGCAAEAICGGVGFALGVGGAGGTEVVFADRAGAIVVVFAVPGGASAVEADTIRTALTIERAGGTEAVDANLAVCALGVCATVSGETDLVDAKFASATLCVGGAGEAFVVLADLTAGTVAVGDAVFAAIGGEVAFLVVCAIGIFATSGPTSA